MTQVDLEALASVCGVGDRKIVCEPLADEPQAQAIPESTVLDYAPESFWLSKDAEFDWFDRNAFLERKESIKGNSNSMNLNLNPSHSNANASSLQISAFLKSKAAQKTNYVDSKRRNCKLTNILLFPKRSDSIGKEPAVLSMTEPSSPKVSCLGRVRSKSCPRRRKANRPVSEPEKPVTRREKTGKVQKLGFISCIQSLFRFDCHGGRKSNKSVPEFNDRSEYSAPRKINVTRNQFNEEQEATADLAALGGVTH
ncbi:hypothetical protein L1987_60051 [Smallanthus sonchifolius]|uniref:Uncharacterized protein n=1 Tax=Smallanthus sonchifolius TaxID=185202 RepID=A0ACB9D7C7_9ASTR|nr:hypothetical protein L1987_60051 [Smallanthus sonchifolius]